VHAAACGAARDAVARDFPEVTVDYLHVDAAMIFLRPIRRASTSSSPTTSSATSSPTSRPR
jgi:hypothetical protein